MTAIRKALSKTGAQSIISVIGFSFIAALLTLLNPPGRGRSAAPGQGDIAAEDAHTFVAFPGDFTGDGSAEIALYDYTAGRWDLLLADGTELLSGVQWGAPAMLPVPADFDGDGRCDLAVFDPLGARWYVMKTCGAVIYYDLRFGPENSIPAPADYDGDGIADPAVYDPVNKQWHILFSSSGESVIIDRGIGGGEPLAGDFNGDGRADLALVNPASGRWHVSTIDGQSIIDGEKPGGNGHYYLTGDYNGDGRADLAAFDPRNAVWNVKSLTDGVLYDDFKFGHPDSVPLRGDFDGDGRADLAVYNPVTGAWAILPSSGDSELMVEWRHITRRAAHSDTTGAAGIDTQASTAQQEAQDDFFAAAQHALPGSEPGSNAADPITMEGGDADPLPEEEPPDGFLRWARKLFDPDNPQPAAICLNGLIEDVATNLTGNVDYGQVSTFQWSGANQAGGASWAGNTLVGPPGVPFAVRLDLWEIREGALLDSGEWKYFPRMAQDAQLRFGFMEPAAAELEAAHGADFGLDGVLPYDAVIVCLPFRIWPGSSRTVWQTGWFGGNPLGAGVWQVRAGQSIRQAQQAVTNRIGSLGFLSEIRPDANPSFQFQVGEGGEWALLVDIDRNGEVDIDVTGAMPGNTTSALTNVSMDSGLFITTGAHGGIQASLGRVGWCPITLSVEERIVETPPDPPRNRRPLEAVIPAGSYISPVTIEGRRWSAAYQIHCEASSLDAPREALYLDERNFLAEAPLDPEAPVSVSLIQDCYPPAVVTGAVEWTVIDLSTMADVLESITLLPGQSLLLTASGEGGLLEIRWTGPDGQTLVFSGQPGDRFVVTCHEHGTYQAEALIDGQVVGQLTANAVAVAFPRRIVCQVNHEKTVPVILPDSINPEEIQFTAADPGILTVSVVERSPGLARIKVRPLSRGTPVIEARSAAGVLLATCEVTEFTLDVQSLDTQVFDGDTLAGRNEIIIRPYIEKVGVRLTMFASRSTFTGGATELWLGSDVMQRRYDDATGEYVAVTEFEIEMPDWENQLCYSTWVYDELETDPATVRSGNAIWSAAGGAPGPGNGDDEDDCGLENDNLAKTVGWHGGANPRPAIYKVERIWICAGSSKEQQITFVRIAGSCSGHTPVIINGPSGATQPFYDPSESVNCEVAGRVFPLNVNATNATPGRYDVKIDSAVFTNRVIVRLLDLDLDSDSTHDYDGWPGPGEPNDYEDSIEEGDHGGAHPGLKFIVVNDFHEYTNSRPGFADGFNLDGVSDNEDDVMTPPYAPTNVNVFIETRLHLAGFHDPDTTLVTFTYPYSDPLATVSNTTEEGRVWFSVPEDGLIRIWRKGQGYPRDGRPVPDGDFIPAGTQIKAVDLGFTSFPGEVIYYIEAVTNSAALEDISITAEATEECDDGTICRDTVKATAIRADVDVDTANTQGYEMPLRTAWEDQHEDLGDGIHPGKILIINDNDDDEDGIIDMFDGFGLEPDNPDSKQTEGELFYPVVFEIPEPVDLAVAHIRLEYPASDPAAVTRDEEGNWQLPTNGMIRIWNVPGDQERNPASLLSGSAGNYVEPGEYTAAQFGISSGGRSVVMYIEAVRHSAEPGDIRIVFSVDPNGPSKTPGFIAVDAVRCTAVARPYLIAVSDYFTPRQSESPPYHACKADYRWLGEEDNSFESLILLDVKHLKDGSERDFYLHEFDGTPEDDTLFYELGTKFDVTELYQDTNTYRLAWDGRKDTLTPDIVDIDIDPATGKPVWADRPANTAADPEIYNIKVIARYVFGDYEFELESEPLSTKTTPLPLDEDDQPMMGSAPYFGFFRDMINSRYSSLMLAAPGGMTPAGDGRPVTAFRGYYNHTHWRHTPMGFNWTHNYEIRILPVFVAGERRLYLLWEGDHLLGPAQGDDGVIWIFGEKALLEENENGWILTTREESRYYFDTFGHITEIRDRNDNGVEVELDDYPNQLMIKRVARGIFRPNGGGTGPDMTAVFNYGDSGIRLTSVTVAGRSVAFSYAEEQDVYGVLYPPDEVLASMAGPEYTWSFSQAGGRRANRASRIIAGPVTNVAIGGIIHNLKYEPDPQEAPRDNVVTDEKIVRYYTGPLCVWRNTRISGSTAVWGNQSGQVSESHAYQQNKLQSVTRGGLDGGTFRFDYNDLGQRKRSTGGGGKVINYDYDDQGNLTLVTAPDYDAVHYQYGAANQVRSVSAAGRVTDFVLDARGNATRRTERGGSGTPDRSWRYVRNADGSIGQATDPKGISSDYRYLDNSLGLPNRVIRSGINTLDREYDTFGNNIKSRTPKGGETETRHDNWNRVTYIRHPDGGIEEFAYRSLNDLTKRVFPAAGAPGRGITQVFAYVCPSGRPKSHSESGNGVSAGYGYISVDNEGNVCTVNITDAISASSLTHSYGYDCFDRRISESWGSGASAIKRWQRHHDIAGNVIHDEDGAGNVHHFTHYSDNAVATQTRPANLGGVTWQRDGVGNPVVITDDPGGEQAVPAVTRNTFDNFNRLTATIDPRGYTWSTAYDPLDNVTGQTDGNNNTTQYEYDNREYRELIRLPDGNTVQETRDENGSRIAVIDPRGNQWQTPVDVFRRPESLVPPVGGTLSVKRNFYGSPLETAIAGRKYTTQHNDRSQGIEMQMPSGSSATALHGPAGINKAQSPDGVQHEFERADDGRVTSAKRADVTTLIEMDGNFAITRAHHDQDQGSYIDRTRNIERDANLLPGKVTTASGATAKNNFNGHMNLESHQSHAVGSAVMRHDAAGLLRSININDRETVLHRDGAGNVIRIDRPGNRRILQTFNSRNALTQRTTRLGPGARNESFQYDPNLNIIRHAIGNHVTTFDYDAANRMLSMNAQGGISRSFTYEDDGSIKTDTIGNSSTTYSYDQDGRLAHINVQGGGSFAITTDPVGRILSVDGLVSYEYEYDAVRKHLKAIKVTQPGLPGGSSAITFQPDSAGYGWRRTLPEGIQLEQAVNDINTVVSSTISGGGRELSAVFNSPDHVRPESITRSGGAPETIITYNKQKEPVSILHGTSAGVTLQRDANTGYITSRSLLHLGTTENFTLNNDGWILSAQRGAEIETCTYRADGARRTHSIGAESAAFIPTAAGAVREVQNAFLGSKLRAPYESAAIRVVGPGGYLTVEAALTNLVETVGTNTFAVPQIIVISRTLYTNNIALGAQFASLRPTAAAPLIIRGGIDRRTTISGQINVTAPDYVRLQGFYLNHTNSAAGLLSLTGSGSGNSAAALAAAANRGRRPAHAASASSPSAALTFTGVQGAALTACVIQAPVIIDGCHGAQIIGNTFDGTNATGRLTLQNSPDAILQNNIYLNDGYSAAVTWDSAPYSGWNCYWPSNSIVPVEEGSIYTDPGLTADNRYRIRSIASAARGAGQPVTGYNADLRGWYRHLTAPSIGALEFGHEQTQRDAGGRITRRFVAGRRYDYTYDSRGQLIRYTDHTNPANSMRAEYDHLGNRVALILGPGTPGVIRYRFVYQGQDVIAEYVSNPGGGIARRRIYWIRPELDYRIGFVDIEGGRRTAYYYLADQAGTVQQIVREDGVVVNQYDYDTFGNLRPENTFEGVENRYTFQGREWDARAGHYYYRFRTYIPEWGSFTGPDMNLALGITGEPNGIGNYLFCNNNPLNYTDPLGLATVAAGVSADIAILQRFGASIQVTGSAHNWNPLDWRIGIAASITPLTITGSAIGGSANAVFSYSEAQRPEEWGYGWAPTFGCSATIIPKPIVLGYDVTLTDSECGEPNQGPWKHDLYIGAGAKMTPPSIPLEFHGGYAFGGARSMSLRDLGSGISQRAQSLWNLIWK